MALVAPLVVSKRIFCLRSSIHSCTSGGVESALLMQCVVAHWRAQMLLLAFGASDERSGHIFTSFWGLCMIYVAPVERPLTDSVGKIDDDKYQAHPCLWWWWWISSDDLYLEIGVSNYDSCQRFEHCDNAEDHRAEVLWQQGYLWTWWFFLSQLTALKTFEKTHSKCLEKLETSAYGHQCCCYVHLC